MAVVTCTELREWLAQGSARLLHCSRFPHSSCLIPGAFDLVLERLSSLRDLVTALAGWGIGREELVVCYQREGVDVASEVWWLLRTLGKDNTAVLEGGLLEWMKLGFPVTTQEPRVKPVAVWACQEAPQYLRPDSEIRSLQALGQAQVLSTDPSIPNALFYDPAVGLLPDYHLAPPSVLHQVLTGSGVNLQEAVLTVVVGDSASVALLQLTSAGKRNLCVGMLSPEEFHSVPSVSQFLSPMETVYMDVLGSPSLARSRCLSLASLKPVQSPAKVGRVERCADCRVL